MNIYTYMLYAFSLLALLPCIYILLQNRNKLSAQSSPKRSEQVLLLIIVLLFSLIIYGKYIFGTVSYAYYDAGSDTIDQYVPYYLNLLQNVQNGTLGPWNAFFGLGSSFYSYQTWTLDPANLIWLPLCLIFGKSFLSPALVISQIVKILLSCALFWNLSKRYCVTPLARMSGSIVYAFSAQLILWGQHYWMGTMSIMTLVLLNILEAAIHRYTLRTYIALCFTSALSIICSTYNGYMILLFSAIYAFIRCLAVSNTTKEGLIRYVKLAIPVLCGITISTITLIPYASSLMNESARISGGSEQVSKLTYLHFVPFSWILPILSRFLSTSLLTTSGLFKEGVIDTTSQFSTVNSYEFIELSLSVSSIFLLAQLPQLLKTSKKEKRTQTLIIISICLCALYIFNYFLPALSNVLVDPKYRSSFYMDIAIGIGIAWVIDHIIQGYKLNKLGVVISSLLTVLVLGFSALNTASSKKIALLYLILFVGFLICILMSFRLRETNKHISTMLVVGALSLMIVSSVGDAWFVTNWRQAVSKESFPYSNENVQTSELVRDTQDALVWLEEYDPTYYRIDKLYQIWSISDGLINHYSSITTYNSTVDADLITFYRTLWPGLTTRGAAVTYLGDNWDNPTALRLLGEKYLLVNGTIDVAWAYPLKQFNNVTIYGIEGATGPLYIKTAYIGASQIEQLPPEAKLDTLSGLAVVPDEMTNMLDEVASTDGTYNVPDIGSNNELTDSAPDGAIKQPDEIKLIGSSSFEGRITATADGQIGVLAIPYTSAMKVEIDGQSVDTFKVDYGLIGFPLKAGEHTIQIQYEIPQLKLAKIASIIGVASSIVIAFILFTFHGKGEYGQHTRLNRHYRLPMKNEKK